MNERFGMCDMYPLILPIKVQLNFFFQGVVLLASIFY